MNKFNCPFCDRRYIEKESLYDHMDKSHHSQLGNLSSAQVYFNFKNNTNGGKSVISGKPTQWNPETERYERFADEHERQIYRQQFISRMQKKYGSNHILNDPEQQKIMLANRKISGIYSWKSGAKTSFTGSYERDFLDYLENVLNWKNPKDIMSPAPQIIDYKFPTYGNPKEGKLVDIPLGKETFYLVILGNKLTDRNEPDIKNGDYIDHDIKRAIRSNIYSNFYDDYTSLRIKFKDYLKTDKFKKREEVIIGDRPLIIPKAIVLDKTLSKKFNDFPIYIYKVHFKDEEDAVEVANGFYIVGDIKYTPHLELIQTIPNWKNWVWWEFSNSDFVLENKFYIPDFYITSIKTIVEIKASEDNNTHDYRKREALKEKYKDEAIYSYCEKNNLRFVKIFDKDYSKFASFIKDVKENNTLLLKEDFLFNEEDNDQFILDPEVIEEHDKDHVYVALTGGDNFVAKTIKFFLKDNINHASISLDEDLKIMYSFNIYPRIYKKKNSDSLIKHKLTFGGFAIEKIKNRKPTDNLVVYQIEVTKQQKQKLAEIISQIERNQEQYRYNIEGLFDYLFNTIQKDKEEDKLAWFCSEFISRLFKLLDVNIFKTTPSGKISPTDFKRRHRLKKKIFEGNIGDFRKLFKIN